MEHHGVNTLVYRTPSHSANCINYQQNYRLSKLSQQQQLDTTPKLLNLKRFSSPQVDILYLKDDFLHENEPHPNSSLIIPFLKIFHWSLLVPDEIEYDRIRGGFYNNKGNRLWKGLSYIWLLLIVIYVSLICFNDVNEKYTVKAIVGKITWICYTLFDATVIRCLRGNGDKIAKLLTDGNKISYLCERIANQNCPAANKKVNYSKYIILLACLLSIIFAIAYVLYVITELTAATTNLYDIFMELTGSSDSAVGEKAKWKNGKNVRFHLMERCAYNILASIALTIWLLLASGVEIIWVIFLTMTASFGFYFKRLLSSCTQIIDTNQIDTCEGIRIFTKITLLLEDFNKIFGTTLLWIVIASVMYTAGILGEFLAGFKNEIIYDMLNAIGFLPFLATLYTGSELHRTGQILPSIMKRQFLHLDGTDQSLMLHVIQGTSVVQYDALSHNIGLKGHGFFTISYIFVTSLVGVIITYSLVAVQFKIGEIPLTAE